jgi:phosphomannomutase
MARPSLIGGLSQLAVSPPDAVGTARVTKVDDRCGLLLELSNGGFAMLRRSGTEPMIRIYAEAMDADALANRLRDAKGLLEAAAKGS